MKSKMDTSWDLESSISFKLEANGCLICLEEQCTCKCIVNVEDCARFQCILNKVSKYLLNAIFGNSIQRNCTEGKIPFCATCLTSLQELFKIIEKMEQLEKSIEEFVNIFTMDVCFRHNENKNRNVLQLANFNTDNCSPEMIVPDSPIFPCSNDNDQYMKFEIVNFPVDTEDFSTSKQISSDDQTNVTHHFNTSSNSDFDANNADTETLSKLQIEMDKINNTTDPNDTMIPSSTISSKYQFMNIKPYSVVSTDPNTFMSVSTCKTTSSKYQLMNLKTCRIVLARVTLEREISNASVNHPRTRRRAAVVANAALQKIVSQESKNQNSEEYNSKNNGENRDAEDWELNSNGEDSECSVNESENEENIKRKSKQETASKQSWKGKRLKCTTQSCLMSFHFAKELKKHAEESGHKNIKLYKCEKCTRSFYRKLDMKRHSKCHSMIKCSLCKQIFRKKKSLQVHHYKHHTMNTFKCNVCEDSFRNKISLRQHTKIHNKKYYACTICPAIFIWRLSLKEHIDSTHNGQVYKCKMCSMVFRNKFGLSQHCGLHFKSRISKIFPCLGCTKVHFLEKNWENCIIKNLRIGRKMLTCGVCGFMFKNSKELDEHSVTEKHKNTKAFKCHPCGKTFYRSIDLYDHSRKTFHQNMRTSFVCGVCLKTFSPYSNFQQHGETHMGIKDGNYNCNACGSMYTERRGFFNHIKVGNEKYKCKTCNELFLSYCLRVCHYKRKKSTCTGSVFHFTGEIFACGVCASEFQSSKELDDHSTTRNHENIKSLKCTTCEEHFYRNKDLSLHERYVHRKQKTVIVCPVCPKTFTRMNDYIEHRETHFRRINGKYECNLCMKRYSHRRTFYRHSRTEKENTYRCTKCDEWFPSLCLRFSHSREEVCVNLKS